MFATKPIDDVITDTLKFQHIFIIKWIPYG